MGRCALEAPKLQVTRATNCKLAQACVVPRQPSGYLASYKSQIDSSKFQTRTERVGNGKSVRIQHTTKGAKILPCVRLNSPASRPSQLVDVDECQRTTELEWHPPPLVVERGSKDASGIDAVGG